jgi:hypothetical protein
MATERARFWTALALVAGALGVTLVLAAAQDRPATKPLVRRDLLVFDRTPAAPPVRDIFRPRAAAPGPAAAVRRAGPAATPEAAPAADTPPAFDLVISYIGSVKSGGETLALILRGGQTESVREGDEIVPGYKVTRLTADVLVVQGPSGESRTFPKQGDRP